MERSINSASVDRAKAEYTWKMNRTRNVFVYTPLLSYFRWQFYIRQMRLIILGKKKDTLSLQSETSDNSLREK